LDASGLGVEISEVHVNVLERVATFRRPLTRIAHLNNGDGTLRSQMQPAVEGHNLSDCGLAEIDVVILFQVPFDPEGAGLAVFLLQLEHGVNCAEEDLA
jgi:hypothetical protein